MINYEVMWDESGLDKMQSILYIVFRTHVNQKKPYSNFYIIHLFHYLLFIEVLGLSLSTRVGL